MIALRAYMPTILKQYSMIDVVKCADTIEERAKILKKSLVQRPAQMKTYITTRK